MYSQRYGWSFGVGHLHSPRNEKARVVSSGSHHLESVPCSCPLAHARGRVKPRELAYSAEDLEQAKKYFRSYSTNARSIPVTTSDGTTNFVDSSVYTEHLRRPQTTSSYGKFAVESMQLLHDTLPKGHFSQSSERVHQSMNCAFTIQLTCTLQLVHI
ncbi:hypothetical protein DICVIV_03868 [Dictyocaulus viviparus]|uniref:Uncharacterized protein n=1 Tax=Dictyocaulus viviparus TaxID=29172 RepID=A0A0D8XZV1_DICVI|nr:hypothetical protein DICVIV_03868 [Dictyocaulus viviparus]